MSIPSIEEHYNKNRQRLVKRMTFRTGDEWSAEDVIQESYLRALKYFNSFDGEDLDRWMSVIITNCLREHKNSEKGYSPIEFEEDDYEGEESSEYSRHVMKDIYTLIETKSEVQKEVLRHYFALEYTAKDISEITAYSYSMCHQIILRFRNELKELYGTTV